MDLGGRDVEAVLPGEGVERLLVHQLGAQLLVRAVEQVLAPQLLGVAGHQLDVDVVAGNQHERDAVGGSELRGRLGEDPEEGFVVVEVLVQPQVEDGGGPGVPRLVAGEHDGLHPVDLVEAPRCGVAVDQRAEDHRHEARLRR